MEIKKKKKKKKKKTFLEKIGKSDYLFFFLRSNRFDKRIKSLFNIVLMTFHSYICKIIHEYVSINNN